ncbi:MAG: nuclease PIN [Actinomycetota bacterium]|nr:nuclease PIN [Actinomycetota bacterium]
MSTSKSAASRLPPYSALDEPLLAFDASDTNAFDTNPLRGLARHGPFSRASFSVYTQTIRVASIGPRSGQRPVRELLRSLRAAHRPRDRADYVPAYPGFAQLFGSDIALAEHAGAHVAWPEDLDSLGTSGTRTERLAAALNAALAQLATVRAEFDVAFVHLPDAWQDTCRSTTFDAHDFTKAMGSLQAIPTQVVNDRTFSFNLLASRSWRLGIAQYVKAGGIPWKLGPIPGDPPATAFIGLAYAFRGDPRNADIVTCCSQVFDSDGGGMQFVAYQATDPDVRIEEGRSNPYLSRGDMRAVLARSLRVYQARNGGDLPRRAVIHKLTRFTEEELAGVADALAAVDEIECLEITVHVAWRGVLLQPSQTERPSEPSKYPVSRGTLVPMSGSAALLWGAGDAPAVAARGHFYQGGKSIPRPLLITRHAGKGPLELAGLEALALTKMDWNNDALYDPVPVTLQYSRRLARTIANVPELPNGEYPYRMFM